MRFDYLKTERNDSIMKPKKGFVTIATGKEEYYILAVNLLRTYRFFCDKPLPFAILSDRENEYTKEFDDVIILENATNSYLDKLQLADYIPYDINIFIDSDCLAYGNLNTLFHYFETADDMSCFGRVLSLDDKTGWFEYDNLGDLKSKVTYCVGLHGGIYYMRNTPKCKAVFDSARKLVQQYESFKFKGKFSTPGDEPLVALAMAVNQCKPVPFKLEAICCYWEYLNCMKIDISKEKASILKENVQDTILLHWGTRYTRSLTYKREVQLLSVLEDRGKSKKLKITLCKIKFGVLLKINAVKCFFIRVKNKILRTIGIK